MSRILVLDDNADITMLLKTVLEQWGFEVVAGRNGEEGLDLLSAGEPDAILSNFRMPLMDGMEFLEEVRVHAEWDAIPFVMISAHGTQEYTQAAMDRGANAFLAKPFRVADLNKIFVTLNLKAN